MKLYGLIGYPLGHSFSKKYFTQKFERENLSDCSYELFPIPSIKELPSLINSTPFLKGLNVTIPYKQQVLGYVTQKSDTVKDIGAANTIKIIGDNLVAYKVSLRSILLKTDLNPGEMEVLLLRESGKVHNCNQSILLFRIFQ